MDHPSNIKKVGGGAKLKPYVAPAPMTAKEQFAERMARQGDAHLNRPRGFVEPDNPEYYRNQAVLDSQAAQQAYNLTEEEWNDNLQSDLRTYLEKRHVQTCILSLEDAAKCALNLWAKKNEDGETVGGETLELLKEIHSNVDLGIGMVASWKLSKALGGLGVTVKQYVDSKGVERVIISSLWNDSKMHYAVVNGLNIRKNHPYRITNPTIKQLGVLAEDSVNGFKKGAVLSLIISAVINTNDLVFDDDYHLVDWFGHMGSDLFKAMVVLGVSALLAAALVMVGATVPIVVGVLLWIGVDQGVGMLWDIFKVEDNIVDGFKNATNV